MLPKYFFIDLPHALGKISPRPDHTERTSALPAIAGSAPGDHSSPGLKAWGFLDDSIKDKDKSAVVVVVTGYGDDPIALQAMSLGPLLLIRKPFRQSDITEILNIVEKHPAKA